MSRNKLLLPLAVILSPFVFSFLRSTGHVNPLVNTNLNGDHLNLNLNIIKRQSPGAPFGTGTDSGPPSPQVLPSPNVTATGDWADAVYKARAFVAQLTLEEKVNLTTGIDTNGRCVGNTGSIPRLGFSALCLEDSPLGVRLTDYASAFPAGVTVASTFSTSLIEARGVAMGQEHRGKGVNVALGPMMNMGRVATGGRNWEGFGGDPFLTGVAAANTIKGVQSTGVIACAKHYVGNEQEHFRGGSGGGEGSTSYSSDIGDRTLREVYVWPFEESVKAGVGAIMCAYNRVNSTYSCENSKIINGILKEELDFKGFLLSDWAALESGIPSALAGVDMNQPGFVGYGIGPQDEEDPSTATNSFWGAALVEMVQNGSVPLWRVDDMVTRTLSAYFQMSQDSPSYPSTNFNYQSYDTIFEGTLQNEHVNVAGNHSKVIREIGSAGSVLLKLKKGTLPIQKGGIPRNVAIIGSDAGPNIDGPNGCEDGNTDRGCSQGTLAMGWGSGTADFPYLIDPLSALTTYFHENSPDTVIQFLLNDFNLAQASKIARQASLCMVFANSDSGEGYITVDGNAGDRNNLTLWHSASSLISATTSQCNNTVVVLHTVGPVIVEDFIDNPNVTAVIWAGLPGQESGNSLVDVISGAVVPSGRLPFTIAKDPADYPAQVVYTAPAGQNIIHIPYTEELEIDYRHFDANDITPRFEFGFGLSYTNFAYSGLSISRASSFGKRTEPDAEPADPQPAASSAASETTRASTATATTTVPTTLHSGPIPTIRSSEPASAPSSASSIHASPASANVTTFTLVSTIGSGASTLSGTPTASGSNSINPSNTTSLGPAVTPTGGIGGNVKLYDDALEVKFKVRNIGMFDGNEVAQVYVGFPEDADEPPKVLRGFDRQMITRGQSLSFTITLRNKDIAVWDVVQQAWTIPAGQFTIFVGASSRDIRLSQVFTNNKAITLQAS